MRFLIFNCVVIGALFYLFAGGQPFASLDQDGLMGKVTAAIENTVRSGPEATAAVIEKVKARETSNSGLISTPSLALRLSDLPPNLVPPAIEVAAIKTAPINVSVQKVVPPVMARLAPPKMPKAPPIVDPAVLKRRAEVMATGPVAEVNVEANVEVNVELKTQSKFMTPHQRRRELHALSEEMELLFASSRVQ